MKIYRLHKYHDNGQSAGFEFFSSRRDAERGFNEWMKGEEEWVCSAEGTKIEIIHVNATKVGILRALNVHAGHPDNG